MKNDSPCAINLCTPQLRPASLLFAAATCQQVLCYKQPLWLLLFVHTDSVNQGSLSCVALSCPMFCLRIFVCSPLSLSLSLLHMFVGYSSCCRLWDAQAELGKATSHVLHHVEIVCASDVMRSQNFGFLAAYWGSCHHDTEFLGIQPKFDLARACGDVSGAQQDICGGLRIPGCVITRRTGIRGSTPANQDPHAGQHLNEQVADARAATTTMTP